MKVITKGRLPDRQIMETWWHGREATCHNCGCRAVFEPSDEPRIALPVGRTWTASLRCPTANCGLEMMVALTLAERSVPMEDA